MSQPVTTTSNPAATRKQKRLDAVMRRLLRSPLHRVVSGKLLIVTVVGRKSGRVYENPVAYAEHDGTLLIGTAAKWRHNLRPGEPVRIGLRRREIDADWEVVTDVDAAAEPYRIIVAQNPTHGKYAGISLNSDGSVNREELAAAFARGTAVVRLRPRD
ncbi:nitroreductase/quinone reductase family protein [Nocardia sp. NPDC046763]|uniref:nitroreductase/quinone reductase family protein n=1 Tax=Nocardia sp. NPDC046763 TaxID=3155256 RepID=UPI0033FF738F